VEICGKSGSRKTGTRGTAKAPCTATTEKRNGPPSGKMRACSACAGDYQDPDRTAWPADDEEDSAGQFEAENEFPEEAS